MDERFAVSLIAIVAILAFVIAGSRRRTIVSRSGARMAMLWAGIFAIVILFFSFVASP